MEDFYRRVAEYDALILDADDLINQDMCNGTIKVDISVFDDFVKDAVIYIYCADIDANKVMEFVMVSEDSDGITMEWLDAFSI